MKKKAELESVAPPAAAKRKRARPGTAVRRPELIQFAAAAFSKSGYAAASLRDIGEMAGIKAPSFYHHFSSKEELLSVIVSETLDRIFEMLLAEISSIDDPEQKLRRVIAVHMRFIIDNMLQTKVVFEESGFLNEADRASLKTKQRAILDIYRMLLRTLAEGGRFRSANHTVSALNILAIIHGVYRWYEPDARLTPAQVIDETVQMVFEGLRVRA
jgi:AcrR family transcriptional regulator